MNDFKVEAAATAAKVAPPGFIGLTAWLGAIDWGAVSLGLAIIYTVCSLYWGWAKHRRAKKEHDRRMQTPSAGGVPPPVKVGAPTPTKGGDRASSQGGPNEAK